VKTIKFSIILLTLSLYWASAQSTVKEDYPWINEPLNAIQYYSINDLKTAFFGWDHAKERSFVVLHLGDSHLQNENQTLKVRTLMQKLLGDGGIGLVQPFSIVNTYDARFYKSTHTGIWKYAKSYQNKPQLPLGVRGMTAQTIDISSTFTIKFNKIVSPANNLLSIFASQGDSSYIPEIYIDSVRIALKNIGRELYEFYLPKEFKTITLKLIKIKPSQHQFTIYGMSLANQDNSGCIWHNAGVGAAQYQSILHEDKFVEQAKILHPDLVILDFGTNDILYENIIPINLEKQIIQVINRVREAAPDASILLTTPQDARYRRRHATIAFEFSMLIRTIAKKEKCAFWDWYYISGGPYSMSKWMESGISMNDGIHLNGKGYELKANLLFEAIEKSFNALSRDAANNSLIIQTEAIDSVFINKIDSNKTKNMKAFKANKKAVKKQIKNKNRNKGKSHKSKKK